MYPFYVYKESHTQAHHSQIAQYPREREKSLKQTEDKDTIYVQEATVGLNANF